MSALNFIKRNMHCTPLVPFHIKPPVKNLPFPGKSKINAVVHCFFLYFYVIFVSKSVSIRQPFQALTKACQKSVITPQ